MQRIATNKLLSLPAKKASFVEPMECLSVPRLPEGSQWLWEIKLDGYRALAVKSGSDVILFSRRRKSLNRQFSYIVERLADLPDGTVVDGELVAIDDRGRPDFHLLQSFRAEASRIHYYIFDLLCCKDRDLTRLPLIERQVLLKSLVMIHDKRIRISEYVEAGATELLAAVREQHLEGIVGKQKDSPYQPGKRSGAWIKYRVNRGQELVIGGYTPGPHGIDAIIVGYYSDRGLTYVARIRNGFVPASRRQVVEKLRPLARAKCPFVNLPETRQTRWGEALTAEKMKKCIWVNPELVAQIEFLEWTESDHSAACQVRGVMPSYESSMRNLAKARAKGCPPRPWRSKEEAEMVRRYTFWWFTCRDRSRPSGRDWARQLGITHTWLQKLVRQFEANPDEMWQMQLAYGDPTFAQFSHAKEVSKEMKRRGELRPSYRTKYRFFY